MRERGHDGNIIPKTPMELSVAKYVMRLGERWGLTSDDYYGETRADALGQAVYVFTRYAQILKAQRDQARAQLERVTAERDKARAENYETALRLEQWETSHPWSIGGGDEPIADPQVVRNMWEASERELRARAEAAEAEVRRMRLECHRIGGDESWGAESEAVGATMRLMAARVLDAGDIGRRALAGEKGGA